MLSKEKQTIQDLLSHPGWEVFKGLLLQDKEGHLCLKSRLLADLQAASRAGDSIKAAQFVGQLDFLNVVLDVPVKYLKS